MDALIGYRSADPYPTETRARGVAADDAGHLTKPVAGLRAQISLLETLSAQVNSVYAEDAIGTAIDALEEAIAALHVGADRVLDEAAGA